MLVREHMSLKPVTVLPTASVEDAFHLMREMNIHHLPVLEYSGKLVGFVSEYDLAYISPSPTSSLSVQDVLYHLSRLEISEVMVKNVISVPADAPLEEAARLMVDHGVNALPVMEGTELVGIITETDVFQIFLDMLDTLMPGVRLSLTIPDQKGMIAGFSRQISSVGGNIMSLGQFHGREPNTYTLLVKVAEVPADKLRQIVDECGFSLRDLRETNPAPPAA